jgi:hypothetical protein
MRMEELLRVYEWLSLFNFLLQRKDDKKNQLKYITKYMDINKNLQKNYKELTKNCKKEYDIPHLISEKETLIQSLEDENALSGALEFDLLSISVSGIDFINTTSKKHTSRDLKNHK